MIPSVAAGSALTDAEVVTRVRRGEAAQFEILMRRHNQRVYRVRRAVCERIWCRDGSGFYVSRRAVRPGGS